MKYFKCHFCEDQFTKEDLAELREMGERYHHSISEFVCPDCYVNLNRLPLEEQLKALFQGSKYKWRDDK